MAMDMSMENGYEALSRSQKRTKRKDYRVNIVIVKQ